MHVRVAKGTGAGRKRPLRERAQEWTCRCVVAAVAKLNRGYLVRCPDCGQERP